MVVAWTGPWSSLTKYIPFEPKVTAVGSLGGTVESSWKFAPFVAGTAIMVSWFLIAAFLRPRGQIRTIFRNTFRQAWGALLVGPFIFGLAYVFTYSGMANSMANGFSKVGTSSSCSSPILGWIAVALSGSNTSSNALFGQFQLSVAKLLGAPLLLFPSLNSVGAEVGKPIAPQTASVGVSTTKYVRNEGVVIRYNMAWSLVILAYLILIALPVLLRAAGRDAPVRPQPWGAAPGPLPMALRGSPRRGLPAGPTRWPAARRHRSTPATRTARVPPCAP